MSHLARPGSLRGIQLARTVLDAIFVCQRLGHRYLWVDSLCIIQDDSAEAMSKQLDQMAGIYHRATLTLVAATGDHAGHGLAGVSRARDPQVKCNATGDFELVHFAPCLLDILQRSTWWTRCWTYQEYLASKRLLFFSGSGLCLQNGSALAPAGMHSEVTSYTQKATIKGGGWDLYVFDNFTSRALTFDTDALKAASGIIHTMYGGRVTYGMPWDDFDRAILWATVKFEHGLRASSDAHTFPSWSWISSIDSVSFQSRWVAHEGLSLAYWALPLGGAASWSPRPRWLPLTPSKSNWPHTAELDHGLSWYYGCIKTSLPPFLQVNCTLH